MTLTVQRSNMPLLEWVLLLSLAALWGGAYFFNGIATQELPTFVIVLGRVGGGAVGLLIVLRLLGLQLPSGFAIWRAFLVMALLNNVLPFSLIVWGQAHIASGVASILNATTPLFTVVVAHWLTSDERITAQRLIGVITGFVGVAIMIGAEAAETLGLDVLGQVACLGAALSYAFAAIYGRRFQAMGVKPMATATGQVVMAAIVLTPLALLVDQPWTLPAPSMEAVGSIIGLALLCTTLGYFLFFRILSTAGATNVSLVTLLIPVTAILLGAMFLGEVLAPRHWAGMGLIAIGLAAIDGRLWRAFRQKLR
jgi:drug/metabolite transporter (DMT)-like permease